MDQMQTKPDVDVIVYKGIKFRRYPNAKQVAHRRYYTPGIADRKRGVESLHREIWKDAHGPIPDGHEVHHADEDTLNNDIDNLECITVDEHRRRHGELGTWSKSPAVIQNLDRIRPLTKEWHASAEGIAWHREHGLKIFADQKPRTFQCHECGKSFESKKLSSRHKDGARFCSNVCAARTRRREGRQRIPKICEICGSEFMGYPKIRTCSRSCGIRLQWRSRGKLTRHEARRP